MFKKPGLIADTDFKEPVYEKADIQSFNPYDIISLPISNIAYSAYCS
jgi:hypothetical protein